MEQVMVTAPQLPCVCRRVSAHTVHWAVHLHTWREDYSGKGQENTVVTVISVCLSPKLWGNMWPSSPAQAMSTISHKTVCVWRVCVFGWELDGTGARLSPYSPVAAAEVNWQHLAVWEPKCPPPLPPHPGPSPPSSPPLLWLPLPLAHTWQHQSGCKLWK